MHRLIAGARPGQLVDHANFDGLDNRRANLRIVSLSESSGHRRAHRRSRTGVLGVSRCAHGGWQARITVDRREQYLGFFRSLVAAAFAYNQAAIELRGPLAVLNDLSLLVEEVS
jgi:hypothetical protein